MLLRVITYSLSPLQSVGRCYSASSFVDLNHMTRKWRNLPLSPRYISALHSRDPHSRRSRPHYSLPKSPAEHLSFSIHRLRITDRHHAYLRRHIQRSEDLPWQGMTLSHSIPFAFVQIPLSTPFRAAAAGPLICISL